MIWHVLRGNPQYIETFTENKEVSNRLMDYFICLRQMDRYIYFNKEALPVFYNIMSMLARHDESFRMRFAEHRNFRWAILNVGVAEQYQDGAFA